MLLAVVSMATAQKGLMSGTSALLMAEIQSGLLNEKQVAEQYGLVYVNGEANITAFVELSGDEKALEDFGVKVQSRVGGMQTVCIPMKNYVAFAQSGLCSWLDVGIKPQQKLENARAELGIDGIYNGVDLPHGYDGTGVVVGIIDNGFQYDHPAFYDSTGTTLRIKRAWIQGDTIGTAPAGYSYGRELATESEILAARTDDPNGIHGSHVAGIAARCGGPDSLGRRYRGMAPNADIVMVSATTVASLYDGIAYIRDYAASVGKPCVVNMSLGIHVGPHDGTSSFDRMMDGLHEQYPEGFLVVGAGGNEGHSKLHLHKSFTATDTCALALVALKNPATEVSRIDLWSTADLPFAVSVGLIDPATGDTITQGPWRNSSELQVYQDPIYLNKTFCIASCNGTYPVNNHQNITLTIYNRPDSADTYRVALFLKSTAQAEVHAWSDQVTFVSGGLPGVMEGNTDCTIGEIGGTARSIITVGAYTTATSWTGIDGSNHTYGTEVLGDVTFFSSHGPTIDLRTKPDICAPGEHLISAINSYNSAIVTAPNCATYTIFNGDTAYYASERGTSMASPAVAGIMALWLQQNPQLRYDSALVLIRSTGRTDSLTGILPASGSNQWGWGKINPLAGLTSAPTDVDSNALTNLVIFVRFADDEEIDHSFVDIDSMFNGRTPGCYSVYNYFDAMTYGNVHYNTVYTNNVRNNVIVSYRDIYPRGHFRPYSEDNPEGYTGELPLVGVSMLEIELLERIFNYVDTAGWVNPNVLLDGNGDGDIDNVSIIVKGMCDDWGDLLWPHMEFFPHDSVGHTVTINGVRVHAYNFEFEADSIYFTPKTFCHEMCHSLGLPDLYHYSHYTNIYTAGCWDVMDANWWGANHTAAIIKSKYLHVCDDPIEIICDGDYTLRSVGSSPSQNCYYIRSAVDPTQWFTFEYRRYQDPYEEGIPGTGLIAARWNDTVPLDIYTNGLFDFYTQAHQYWVFRPGSAIDTVNGEWTNANFSAASGRTSFGPTTDPHPYLTDGTPETSFEITNIQENGTELTFHVHFLSTEGIGEVESGEWRVEINGLNIRVDNRYGEEVGLYDIMGRQLASSHLSTFSFHLPASGVYLVKVGDRPAQKVVVVK
jgi:M6 family metalloprotease-like protein